MGVGGSRGDLPRLVRRGWGSAGVELLAVSRGPVRG